MMLLHMRPQARHRLIRLSTLHQVQRRPLIKLQYAEPVFARPGSRQAGVIDERDDADVQGDAGAAELVIGDFVSVWRAYGYLRK